LGQTCSSIVKYLSVTPLRIRSDNIADLKTVLSYSHSLEDVKATVGTLDPNISLRKESALFQISTLKMVTSKQPELSSKRRHEMAWIFFSLLKVSFTARRSWTLSLKDPNVDTSIGIKHQSIT